QVVTAAKAKLRLKDPRGGSVPLSVQHDQSGTLITVHPGMALKARSRYTFTASGIASTATRKKAHRISLRFATGAVNVPRPSPQPTPWPAPQPTPVPNTPPTAIIDGSASSGHSP